MIETKLNGTTPDIAEENIAKLKEIFPDVFCEGKVDFEKLQQVLGNYVEDAKERYSFSWNGKGKSLKLAQSPSTGTLLPCKEESKDWGTTENLYIEGDNLEVLKLLQKSYHNKIKMIYIDPPYNTGHDFVYPDAYKDNMQNYLELTGQTDDRGKKITTNPDTNGRYHTDWLNMMYPRLRLARNLLTDDGVIFISIDDNEVANLKKICDEVFGEDNFVAMFIWNTEGHTDNQFAVKINHEYILLYAKNIFSFTAGNVIDPNTRKESNLWKGFAENSITKNGEANPVSEIELPIGFPCKLENGKIENNMQSDAFFEEVEKNKFITRKITEKYSANYPIRYNDIIIKDFKTTEKCVVFSGWANANKLKEFIANDCKAITDENGDECSFYLSERGVIYYYKKRSNARNILSVLRNMGTTESMRSELEKDAVFFSYPKPTELLKYLTRIGAEKKNSIILDFFSGSATTAHAVMQLNAEDGGNRKFICVQLPEPCDEKSEAFKAGYKNICEIGKERIRRAGDKIKSEIEAANVQIALGEDEKKVPDIGFKVFKLNSSNIKRWQPDFDEIEDYISFMENNFVDDRTELDVVYEIMIKYGLDLIYPVEELSCGDTTLYSIGMGMLIICLANNIGADVAKFISDYKKENEIDGMRVVFKDGCFGGNDSLKTNIKEILKVAGVEEFITI